MSCRDSSICAEVSATSAVQRCPLRAELRARRSQRLPSLPGWCCVPPWQCQPRRRADTQARWTRCLPRDSPPQWRPLLHGAQLRSTTGRADGSCLRTIWCVRLSCQLCSVSPRCKSPRPAFPCLDQLVARRVLRELRRLLGGLRCTEHSCAARYGERAEGACDLSGAYG